MSIEILCQLEEKIQNAIETLSLYRLEIDELKVNKASDEQKLIELQEINNKLEQEKQILEKEKKSWSEKVNNLLEKLEALTEETV